MEFITRSESRSMRVIIHSLLQGRTTETDEQAGRGGKGECVRSFAFAVSMPAYLGAI
jgi:hypothetical protein